MVEHHQACQDMFIPLKIAPPHGGSGPPSNTCFLGPTEYINSISTGSAVTAGLAAEYHRACPVP